MKKLNGKETAIKIKNILVMFLGTFLFVIAMQMFITPANLYAGGLTGIIQLLILLVDHLFGIELSLGILIFIFNIPILWLAWHSIGKRFAALTVVSVILQFILFEIVPPSYFSNDMLLNTVFGGVLIGVGAGMILKIGASSGGMDVVSQFIAMKYDGSVGKYSFMINAVIIIIAGMTQGWETALYTIISIYITSTVVDHIHTIHQNLTLYVVTDKEDEMIQAIWDHLYRGITLLDGRGAYTKQKKSILMIVLSSYELYEVLAIIKSIDENAFTNVVRSEVVQGNFVKKKIN